MREKIYDFVYGLMKEKVLWNDAVEMASVEFNLDKATIAFEYRKARSRKISKKRGIKNGIEYTLTCRDCGKTFERWGSRCVLCKECSKINEANHNKICSKKYYQQHPEKAKEYYKKQMAELKGFSSVEEYELHKRQKEIESQVQKIFNECDKLLWKLRVRTCVVCGCKFYDRESDSYCSNKCYEKAKNVRKTEKRRNDPEFAETRRAYERKYRLTHDDVMDKKRASERKRFQLMPIEKIKERNAARREKHWKNGGKKSNVPDLPINKVYIHTFPNGKVYVGITKNTELRWDNGEGYIENEKMYNDIKLYGWDNIKHEVIADGLLRDDALKIETQYIFMFDSTNPSRGYNRTLCSKRC